jgi:hypothetical protein
MHEEKGRSWDVRKISIDVAKSKPIPHRAKLFPEVDELW